MSHRYTGTDRDETALRLAPNAGYWPAVQPPGGPAPTAPKLPLTEAYVRFVSMFPNRFPDLQPRHVDGAVLLPFPS